MNVKKFYPLSDWPTLEECKTLGVKYNVPRTKEKIMAQWTGENRPPKKGEWFLSGAIIEAYRAKNDLTTNYRIAKLVKVKQITIIEIDND